MEGQHSDSLDKWIPLMEYAMKKGISLSTLRRHIKAKKVKFKVEGGRYLLWDSPDEDPKNESELTVLRKELDRHKEEIAELKTLIALYEEKNSEEPVGP